MGDRGPNMPGVEIRTFKDVDLKGGTVVAAFPSVGLVSTIASTYLISTMQADQVCALESEDYPSLSMIYAKKPKFPARVYALRESKVAIFICAVPLPSKAHRPTAHALLRWSQAHGVRQIVALEGLPGNEAASGGDPAVWGVGSTDRAREELDRCKNPHPATGEDLRLHRAPRGAPFRRPRRPFRGRPHPRPGRPPPRARGRPRAAPGAGARPRDPPQAAQAAGEASGGPGTRDGSGVPLPPPRGPAAFSRPGLYICQA